MSPWRKSFLRARTGFSAGTLRQIYAQCSPAERQLTTAFFPDSCTRLTPFAGILPGPGPLAEAGSVRTRPATVEDWKQGLGEALVESLGAPDGEVAVAVSGGIDSWLLAMLLRSLGYAVRGWYLESGVPGYCEGDRVERLAAWLGIPCRHIRVKREDFAESLPAFLEVTETPIYNLHPVSKLLLARGLRERGIQRVVTGDGADQVVRREWDCDLLPLTLTCFQSQDVRLVTPFLSPQVLRLCHGPDPNKRVIRELAARLGVPSLAKHPTLFPSIGGPVSCWDHTTEMIVRTLERPTCAASPA